MFTITVGLKEIQNKGPDWDENSCFGLVNQIGKKLEEIGRLDDLQKMNVLKGSQIGGFIQWHTLSAGQTDLFRTHWDGCMDVFSASATLEDHSRVMPKVLEKKQFAKFVRDFGSNLEQLCKLKRSQAKDIWRGLEIAGFVERSQVQEVVQDNHSVPSSNCNTDVMVPTASSPSAYCLSTSDPKTSGLTNNDPSIYVDSGSWMNYMHNHGGYPGSEIDQALDISQMADESVPFMTLDTIPLSTPHLVPGRASPADSISTTGLAGKASSYSTPSNMYPGSPQVGERANPRLVTTMFNQPAEIKRLVSQFRRRKNRRSNWSMQSRATPVMTRFNQTTLHLLQSCRFSQGRLLEEERIQRILEVEVLLAAQDPCGMLQPLLGEWRSKALLGLHALGLPALWEGVQGAVNYLRVLDADDTDQFLDPIAKRIGQVLLYFSYKQLCKQPENTCSPSRPKPNTSRVLNCILNAYSDDPRISISPQSRRNKISGYHVRRGRWWWKLAGTLGVGILLISDSSLISTMCNNTFTNDQINALVTLALNTRPGTLRIFRALEPMVKFLMFGFVTDDLYQVILNDELGLLGQHELAQAYDEDEAAMACQRIENPWTVVDAEYLATEKMTEFLASMPAT